jgi:ribA/ribD-fused uncharacterized protein
MNTCNIRSYNKNDVIFFRKTNEYWGGLSNMASGYPIFINNICFRNSETLYQVLRFPEYPLIQERILKETSPMTVKMKSRKHISLSRYDWVKIRVSVMRWVLRAKLACNFENFSKLLLNTGDKPIVEYSSKDNFWGAYFKDDVFVGQNALGRLLMELREDVKKVSSYMLEKPKFENARILNQNLGENCYISKTRDNHIKNESFENCIQCNSSNTLSNSIQYTFNFE